MPPRPLDIAIISALRCLASELTKKGVVSGDDLIDNIQQTAIAHRQRGNAEVADLMHMISEYLITTMRDA